MKSFLQDRAESLARDFKTRGRKPVVILDRGLFDSIAWLDQMRQPTHIRRQDWEKAEGIVLDLTAGAFDFLGRLSYGVRWQSGAATPLSISQSRLIIPRRWNSRCSKAASRPCSLLPPHSISNGPSRQQVQKTEMHPLISEQLEEDILCAPKTDIVPFFSAKECVTGKTAATVADYFVKNGSFVPRAQAESAKDLLQALPIVIVKTKSGRVLRLRRREKDTKNPLNKRDVVWAGGHVRKEDASNGNSLIHGALRELHEALQLVGAIYSDLGGSTSKHVAIVHQWTAPKDDVDIVLSGTEFFERRGTSMRGEFVEVKELIDSMAKADQALEPWSELIVRNILAVGSGPIGGRLL